MLTVLNALQDPIAQQPLPSGSVKGVHQQGQQLQLHLQLPYPVPEAERPLWVSAVHALVAPLGITQVEIQWSVVVPHYRVRDGLRPLPGIRNIIVIASGKGGVGKSTTAANMAIALAQTGAQVGLLDADIYGPSQPLLFGVSGKPAMTPAQKMQPHQAHGVKVNSFGFLIKEDEAAIWRGPMVIQAMNQLLTLSDWGELDYLLIDMPPGTGDIALSLAQKTPLVGAVVVTTPQDIALLDVQKGVQMFHKVGVPILGVVENMASHVCSQCGHVDAIFGQDGGQSLAERYDLPYLGALPLQRAVRECADQGTPIVQSQPQSQASQCYRQMVRRLQLQMAQLPKDSTHKFPPIVVQT